MKSMITVPLLWCVLMMSKWCKAERIWVMSPICTKSHKMSFMPLAEALAEKGHTVTVITSFPPLGNQKLKNLTEIVVENNFDAATTVDWFDVEQSNPIKLLTIVFTKFREAMKDGYDHLMNNKEFKKIFEAREVDIVIVDAILNEFVLPIIDHLQVPFIFYCTTTGAPWVMEMFNIPHDYATVPSGTGDERGQMSFIERLNNMWSSESFKLLRKIFLINMMDNYIKKEFPNSRTIAEIERDAQLCFINSHPATSWTRTLPPHVIPLGALHVRPAKLLPNELQVMADNADQGFIVFSLGSTIPVSSMPEHVVQMFIRVFSRIPEHVIWKWEKSNVLMDNLPANVKIVDWLPQQDLLGHENSRLFISHGGLLGIQETVYHGVPILGIPFGNDQLGNMAKVCDEGYGLKLSWGELSEELLYNNIQLLLHEPSFQGNATRLSKLMRDPVMPGRELGVYWVEHVLRHGGKHLMSPSKNMPFYKAYLLDVWLFLILINSTIFYVIAKSLTFIVRKLKDSKVKVQ